jgi:neutral trehalase
LTKRDFPKVHFYDQDFVDIYDRSWTWLSDYWVVPTQALGGGKEKLFLYPHGTTVNQFDQICASFFLVYSNRIFPANSGLDFFYGKQEANGAIRASYDVKNGKPTHDSHNPDGLSLPLFAWAEYNIYHKTANKKRIKEVMPALQKYFAWLETFKKPNGLYATGPTAACMPNSPREKAKYLIDFNAAMAVNALYMSALGDILNDKEIGFQYKRAYFGLKTRINTLMWNPETGFYHDLDEHEKRTSTKTIGGFYPLLAEIPNEERAERLIAHLKDPAEFGTEHPIPTLAANHPEFDPKGGGYRGSVFPSFSYVVLKGLEKYNEHELARDIAIRHMYFVLDSLSQPEQDRHHERHGAKQTLWEAYQPQSDGKAVWPERHDWPRPQYIHVAGLTTIAMMIENVIGLFVSLPRKTVDWIVPSIELMGIENMSLKRNMITILSSKSPRGWEIHMESEKLYYFTINMPNRKKKTLPIPSGKCSMLLDKL